MSWYKKLYSMMKNKWFKIVRSIQYSVNLIILNKQSTSSKIIKKQLKKKNNRIKKWSKEILKFKFSFSQKINQTMRMLMLSLMIVEIKMRLKDAHSN